MAFLLNKSFQDEMPNLNKIVSQIQKEDIPASFQESLSKKNGKESCKELLYKLLDLLPQEIQNFVEDALAQKWPFLPPTINPTMMTQQNKQIPKLKQVEILLLSLNFAFESEEFELALAIALVVDRFVYYCDGSAALLKLVDQIQNLAPHTAVGPQLVIRKARLLKDNGDLHGSIQILNNLLGQKWDENNSTSESLPKWQYKDKHQYTNVAAVCVQIQGQIYHNLGLWKDAIAPLMKSNEWFETLPVIDYKGISYSNSLLSRCLCRLSKREYLELSKVYSFQCSHPCYEAYRYGMLAFEQGPRQRLFLSKHLLQSAESLLMYAVQLSDSSQKKESFQRVLQSLNLVLTNQKREEYSKSKEQLFVFIKSLFVTCLTLGCSFNQEDRHFSHSLESICLFLYKNFCQIGANQLDSWTGEKYLQRIIPALNFAISAIIRKRQKTPEKSPTEKTDNNFKLETNLPKDIKLDTLINVEPQSSGKVENTNKNVLKIDQHKPLEFPILENRRNNDEQRLCSTEKNTLKTENSVGNYDEKKNIIIQNSVKKTTEMMVTAGGKTPVVDCDVDTKERMVTTGGKTPVVDCDVDTKERMVTAGGKTPVVDCDVDTKERMVTTGGKTPVVDCDVDTKERMVTNGGKTPVVDCDVDTKERMVTTGGKTPVVDCDVETKERMVTTGGKTPMVDCNAVTKERMVTNGGKTLMVDCNAETKERMVTTGGKTPMVDCNAETKERMVTTGGKTPMVDCDEETKERMVTTGGKTPMVDCAAETKERMVTTGGKTPMVDCDAETKERIVTTGGKTPMVDCNAVTKERMVTTGGKTPVVDCEAVTKERMVTTGGKTPMVDCNAETKERMVTTGGKTPVVDCNAETKERMVTTGGKTPVVDCDAETKDKMVTTGGKTPMVDCDVETKERMVTTGGKTPMVDCNAETKERMVTTGGNTTTGNNNSKMHLTSPVGTHDGSSDSGFESSPLDVPLQFQCSVARPRFVGLPSHISAIQSKHLSPKLANNPLIKDFPHETNQRKDASLVNTAAMTAIRQSMRNGTFENNRIINKFQRQESLPEEIPFTNPGLESENPESFLSFLGNLLAENLQEEWSKILGNSSLPKDFDFRKEENSLNEQEFLNKIQKATLYQYNPVTCIWSRQDTIVSTGKELTMAKGKKGSFRNVYEINFLHQEEPLGKYVSKRYRDQREILQYLDDVVCQMQAGLYVNLFNQALKAFELDLRIHFLTAAFMLKYDSNGQVDDWMNTEPFVDGEFLKLTNNFDYCNPRGQKVSTSFTHFTYVQSKGKLMVCDLQGWLPSGSQNLIYLTDPQFHTESGDSSPFDFGCEGFKGFFDVIHPQCNDICKTLNLQRPVL